MKDYYHIMGVTREASEVEIKRSFRKLAVLYHPDRNHSLDAEQIFKEINEAYEVLSDPASRSEYDQRLANIGFYTLRDAQPWQHHPGYDAGRAAYQRRSSGPSERTLFMLSMLKFTQVLFYFGCMWCTALLVDYVMPSRVQEEIVVSDLSLIPKLQLIRNYNDLLVTDRGHHFPLGVAEMKYFPHGTPIRIYSSSLFSALIRVENYNGSFVINNLGTIYRNFSFAPILMFISCLTGLVVKKGIEFHVNLGIVIFLLMILNIIFLFTSRI